MRKRRPSLILARETLLVLGGNWVHDLEPRTATTSYPSCTCPDTQARPAESPELKPLP